MRVLLAVLFLTSFAIAQDSGLDTYEPLVKASYFAIGGVGYAGVTSKGELNFRRMLKQPNALDLFEELYTIENPAAKAYALLGLHLLAAKRYDELAAKTPKEWVLIEMTGCLMNHVHLDEVIERISAGAYDRRGRDPLRP